jgi:hypothetical protein
MSKLIKLNLFHNYNAKILRYEKIYFTCCNRVIYLWVR